jgi:hypothetical protein
MDAARRSARRAAAAVALGCLLLACAVVGAADGAGALRPVSGPHEVEIGIADQKPSVFDDARLRDLGLRYARRSVHWDALSFREQRRDLDAWIDGVRLMGAEPLITFSQGARRHGRRYRPPSATEFARQFRRFRRRYPDVQAYSTWNEANMCGAGLCARPELAAAYFDAIRRNCAGCRVLAVDLVDQDNMIGWVRAFRRATRVEPRLWGLHNYIDANRFETVRTRAMLREVRGEIWLTEVGGIVARRNGSRVRIPQGKAHAARATRFIFDRLARLSPRITRVYIYHWRSSTRRDSWDSAFIGSDGSRRPSLRVFEQVLRETRPDL